MKTFKHDLVEHRDIDTINIDGKRHYVTPVGNLMSVTTVLGERLDKTGLLEWRAKVGEEEANKVSAQAARRGTAIHDMAEKYVLNDAKWARGHMPANLVTFKSLQRGLDAHVDNVRGCELALFNKALGCAGRTDLIADWDGRLSIIDFKTSRRMKTEDMIESYFLQATVYSMMFEKTYGIPCEQIVILIAVDHEPEPLIFVRERAQYVERVLQVFVR